MRVKTGGSVGEKEESICGKSIAWTVHEEYRECAR